MSDTQKAIDWYSVEIKRYPKSPETVHRTKAIHAVKRYWIDRHPDATLAELRSAIIAADDGKNRMRFIGPNYRRLLLYMIDGSEQEDWGNPEDRKAPSKSPVETENEILRAENKRLRNVINNVIKALKDAEP